VIELLHSFTKKYNYLRLEYALKIEDLDCAYWSPEQIRAVNEFHKESENFFKLRKRDENYDSIIVGLLTMKKVLMLYVLICLINMSSLLLKE
jgi:hypothetical protein